MKYIKTYEAKVVDTTGFDKFLEEYNRWKNSYLELVDELIKHGADVYFKAYQWKSEDDDFFDYWDWVNQIFFEYRPKIYNIIKKYHPDFEEERELRKQAKKYNL